AIDYVPGEGKLVLSFSLGIIPYLSQLSREFTKYKLKHVARFESVILSAYMSVSAMEFCW
ncbi:RepB family plasmid replication initiator protein, partial [Methylomonas albis]